MTYLMTLLHSLVDGLMIENKSHQRVDFTLTLECSSLHIPFLGTSSTNAKHFCYVHPKLCNINPYNVIHYTISQNPMNQLFLVQILLLIVTFLSLNSQVLPLMQTIIEFNPNPRIVPCVNTWSVIFFFLCHLLNCWCMNLSHCLGRPSGR